MRKIYAPLFLILAAVAWGQNKGTSVFIAAGSKTDQPANPRQASDEATAAAHVLEDSIAIEIQKRYPCSSITEDRDLATLIQYERNHAIMDPNYNNDLSSMAGSLGARYLISVSAIQSGGQIYMQALCMDTKTARTVERASKQTNSQDAVDNADSLARDFAKALSPLFAAKLESGKTYPVGTVFPAVYQVSYRQHAKYKSTYTKALAWRQSSGAFESQGSGGSGELQCHPEDWGNCGGCSDCACAGNCTIKLNSPGRYRLVNYTVSIDTAERKVDFVAEVTIEGGCKK